MSEPNALDARLVELESKISFAEDLLDTLNMTVFRQQREIERLQKQLAHLQEQLRNATTPAQPLSLRDEIPPHY
ncbi:SlyX family protein [Pseudothauera rhizosphaerae]|nr:SlyX family protein [Pseudothauera rhizosphaerae]